MRTSAIVKPLTGQHQKCSTPWCNSFTSILCDHPVDRAPDPPKVGDARMHTKKQSLFYVRGLSEDGRHVTVSDQPPGGKSPGTLKPVPVEEWIRKTASLCDAPVCAFCAELVGQLNYCQGHGTPAGAAP